MNTKGQGLPISTIIIAALGLLVLVVVAAIFGGQMTKIGVVMRDCPGRCADPEGPYTASAMQDAVQSFTRNAAACNAGFETALGGESFYTKEAPVAGQKYLCKACCQNI
jgi:hypothetical protein